MATLSISLSVARDARFAPVPGHTAADDPSSKGAMQHLRQVVIQQPRHQRRCAGCDFAFGSGDQFELHHLDGDHRNNDPMNLVPICAMCHAAFHLDLVTRRWRDAPGTIVFLPELTQGQFNNVLQAIVFAKLSQQKHGAEKGPESAVGNADEDPLMRIHTLFMGLQRRAEAVEKLPDGSEGRPGLSKPSVLARVLTEMTDEDYAKRDTLLYGLRYLPAEETLLTAAEEWGRHGAAFAQLEVAQWAAIAGVAA